MGRRHVRDHYETGDDLLTLKQTASLLIMAAIFSFMVYLVAQG